MAEAEKINNSSKRNEHSDTQQTKQPIEQKTEYHYPTIDYESTSNEDQAVRNSPKQMEQGHEHIVEQVDRICREMDKRMEAGLVGKDGTETDFQTMLNQMQLKFQQDLDFVTNRHCKLNTTAGLT
jgi:hypothetical protein